MANEFKIKKGLIVTGASGGTVVNIQGSQGQLFSVTDDLSGSIFAVSDISGVPIFDVNSSGLSTFDGALAGTSATFSGDITLGDDLNFTTNGFADISNTGTGAMRFKPSSQTLALTLTGANATFAGNINLPTDKYLRFTSAASGSSGTVLFGNTTGTAGDLTFKRNSDSANMFKITGSGNAEITGKGTSSATITSDGSSTLTTKGYVDSLITGATIYRGTWDPDVSLNSGYGNPNLNTVTKTSGYYYICSDTGTAHPNGTTGSPAVPCEPNSWEVGDWVVWNDDVPDCPGTGTGAWQKIDNTSVLSGIGTGSTVALWQGASSVTDSETLGNAPITVSGNNTTFAGTVSTGGYLTLNSGDNIPRLIFNGSGDDFFLSNTATYFGLYNDTDSRWDIQVDGAGDTTFGGVIHTSKDGGAVAAISTPRIRLRTDGVIDWGAAYNAGQLTWDSSSAFVNGLSGRGLKFATNGSTLALTLDTSQNATFEGNVTLNAYGAGYLKTDSNGAVTAESGIPGTGTFLPLAGGTMNSGAVITFTVPSAGGNFININHSGNEAWTFAAQSGTGIDDYIDIGISGGTRAMSWHEDGKVAIGTTAPLGKLHVYNTATTSNGNGTASETAIGQDSITLYGHGGTNGQTYGSITWMGGSRRRAMISAVAENADTDYIGLVFYTQGTDGSGNYNESMRISRSGNVGIGTSSPALQSGGTGLHINATTSSELKFTNDTTGSTASDGTALVSNANDFTINNREAGTMTLGTSNSPRITILSGGNVGINVTGPSKKLEVAGSFKLGTNAYIEYGGVYPYTITTANTAAVGNLVFSAGLGSAAYESRIDLQGTNTAGVAGITLSTASTARMVVTADGDVGIGTTTPLAKLDIQGTQGQLFSVTDDLSGSLFAVADISGVPIFDVNSSGVSYFDGLVKINPGKANNTSYDALVLAGGANSTSGSGAKMYLTGTVNDPLARGTIIEGLMTDNSNAHALVFSTSGSSAAPSERMRITSAGELQVTGNGVIRNEHSSANFSYWQQTSTDARLFTQYAQPLYFGTDGSTKMTILSGGNVGIGVTSPTSYKLEVAGSVGIGFSTGNKIVINSQSGFQNSTLESHIISANGLGGFGSGDLLIQPRCSNVGANSIIFGTSNNTNTTSEKMRVLANGNVGIGTTSPDTKLMVSGEILSENSNGGYFVSTRVPSSSSRPTLNFYGTALDINYVTGYAGGGASTAVSILTNGNVGIGVTGPGEKLEVDGTVKANKYTFDANATNPTSTTASIYDQASVGLTISAHNLSIRNYNGSAMMESARFVHDKLTVAGDVIAYGSPSDKRLKENIKPIESALDKAMKLQGVTFDWKESDSLLNIKEDIGFIAQDVQKVVPKLVRENKDGMLSMRHQGITPILLEAIKELKAEIEDLKKKIK